MSLERSISRPHRKPDGRFGLGSGAEMILGLVYPPVCALCHQQRADPIQGYVCDTCQSGVRRITEPCCQRCGIPFSGTIIGSQTCAACRRDSWAWDEARAAAIAYSSALDKAVKSHVIHRNSASNHKAQWAKLIFAKK